MLLFDRWPNFSAVALSAVTLPSLAACSRPEPLEHTAAPIMANLSREVGEYEEAVQKWLALDELSAQSNKALDERYRADTELFSEAAALRAHILSEYPKTPVSGIVCKLPYFADGYSPKDDARSHLEFNKHCLKALEGAIKAGDPDAAMKVLDDWLEDKAFLRFY